MSDSIAPPATFDPPIASPHIHQTFISSTFERSRGSVLGGDRLYPLSHLPYRP
ncbi:MAG: hypothetical protein SFY66_20460 [Oculatellaceae cyanobacterium bins.114]|nr:hypothetical protein [Oculatellaceae cyanobacterium bins.114]